MMKNYNIKNWISLTCLAHNDKVACKRDDKIDYTEIELIQ